MNAPPVIAAPGECSTDPDANPSLRERSGISAPVLAFVGLLLLLVVARVAVQWNLPTPFCGLKRLTGIPCPFCGSTRCLQACSSFDFAEAMRWNPLTFLACGGVVLWFVLWVASTISESRIGTMNQRRTGTRTALSASASDLIRADMAVRAPIAGSWKASIRFCARIGTMNRCASQRRGPDRGSATRSLLGSWRADRVFNRRCAATVRFAAPALKPALIAAVLLNWIYLCLTLP
ncbi:MAG: hypothetical protein DME24_00315 [Verrucomicrobia bacterium]|nr:MAG: hypothetical protein DME24_00315 [Verrucomicrobiota bacterium]